MNTMKPKKTVDDFLEESSPSQPEYDYLGKSASVTDQTGLIPSGITDRAELTSYEELYPFLPPMPPVTSKSRES